MNVPSSAPRHARFVRVTHWVTALAFAALLLSGVEILLSHPRFYWGETGNVNETPLFSLPVPASRRQVPTGYDYVLRDQNGWSRYLHFQSAWLLAFTGFAYLVGGLRSGHFRTNLMPASDERRWNAIARAVRGHIQSPVRAVADPLSYNLLQRIAYLVVIFLLVPAVIWTGLAMSPGFTSISPATVNLLGGKQSARTLHFAISIALILFVLVHVAMVALGGFTARMTAMITGHAEVPR